MTTRKWLLVGAAGLGLGLTVSVVGVVIANRPCGSRGLRRSLQAFRETETAWTDAAELAASIPRYALPAKVESMQRIRARARSNDLGECFAEVKRLQLTEMDSTIEETLGFLANGTIAKEKLAVAREAKRRKNEALDAIREAVEPEALALDRAERAAKEKEAKERKAAEELEAARLAEAETRRLAAEHVRQAAESAAAEASILDSVNRQYLEKSRDAEAKAGIDGARREANLRAESDIAASRTVWAKTWPQRYLAPMAPVKAALGAMLRERGGHCGEFRTALSKMDFPGALVAGGPDVWFQGRKVKEALEGLAANCGNGGTADLDEAISSLTRALRPYGLTP
jgi:hypothetical protein